MRKSLLLWTAIALIVVFAVAASVYCAAKKAGTLKLTNDALAMEINFGKTMNTLVMVPPKRGVNLPEGTYLPTSWSIMAQDKKGNLWKLHGLGTVTGQRTGSITITEGQTTELDIGPPLTVTASAQQMDDAKGKLVSIGLSIKGKGGEWYTADAKMGTQSVPNPTFQILDENKRILAQGAFAYG
jgi:hypothetical protein